MRPSPSSLRFLRQPVVQRRFASTNVNAEAAQKKAQEAFGAAQKGAAKAWESTVKFFGPLGERVGSMLGSYRAPLTYNLAVTREVLKHIYLAERLQPPSLAQVQSVYATLWQRATSPAYLRDLARTGEWARVGVYGLEAYGIYKIGEIIGRRSLVGYNVQ
ncbi:mitochondrial ATP synthase g subunit-domain-containing protein [Amylostereum chailletii]|nr:mitochondrial ATP synthase g subunit-domain-containing protein [Amylostereum chailletii]